MAHRVTRVLPVPPEDPVRLFPYPLAMFCDLHPCGLPTGMANGSHMREDQRQRRHLRQSLHGRFLHLSPSGTPSRAPGVKEPLILSLSVAKDDRRSADQHRVAKHEVRCRSYPGCSNLSQC